MRMAASYLSSVPTLIGALRKTKLGALEPLGDAEAPFLGYVADMHSWLVSFQPRCRDHIY